MAEGNDPGTTPPVPVNPFVGGGFEQNIDQQKGFQNDLIAQQGQGVRALYDRTGASAKDVLQSQLSAAGGNPTARTALFQAYVDDAKAGEARSAQSVQRQAALGNMFMDQTKAAIPLYAKNVDATTEAMRLQFEERRRKEEQNYQLQREQLASSRANSRPKTYEEKLADALESEKIKQDVRLQNLVASGAPIDQYQSRDVQGAGLMRGQLSFKDALAASARKGFTDGEFTRNDREQYDLLQMNMDDIFRDNDYTFAQAAGAIKEDVDGWYELEGTVVSPQVVYTLLSANAPRWGLTPDHVYKIYMNMAAGGSYSTDLGNASKAMLPLNPPAPSKLASDVYPKPMGKLASDVYPK